MRNSEWGIRDAEFGKQRTEERRQITEDFGLGIEEEAPVLAEIKC